MRAQFFSIKHWEKEYIQNKIQTLALPIEAEFIVDQLDKDHLPPDTSAEIEANEGIRVEFEGFALE